MRNSLAVTINGIIAFIVLTLGGTIGTFFIVEQNVALKDDLNRRVAFMAREICESIDVAVAKGDTGSVTHTLNAATLDPEVAYIMIKSASGDVQAARWEDQAAGEVREYVFPLHRHNSGNDSFGSVTSQPEDGSIGTISIGINHLRLQGAQRAVVIRTVSAVIVSALVSMLIGSLIVRHLLRRSLAPLLESINQVGAGNLAAHVSHHRHDEIGQIAIAFNDMAGRLAATLITKQELEAAVEERTAALRDSLRERTQAQKALAEREEHIRLLLESTTEAIVGLDLTGKCTFCNPATIRMFGFQSVDDVIGQSLHRLIHHTKGDRSPYPEEECPVYQKLRTRDKVHIKDCLYWKADGTPLHAECWSNPVFDGDEVIGVVLTFIDISDRLRLERQLLQSQKLEAIGLMAGGIAHDFNNLLTPIVGYAEVTLRQLDEEHPARRSISAIIKSASRAADFTRQILAFSRKQVLEMRVVDLNSEIAAAEKMLKRLIGEDIEVRVAPSPSPLAVKADPAQLHQILLNLAVNSRDAMPEGGTLTIETSVVDVDNPGLWFSEEMKPGRYALLQVTDSGCGMDDETKRHIFDPFFTTKDVDKGTGLGLSTVHGIVKQHGGDVSVYSEIGVGTTFKVYIPYIDAAADQPTEQIEELPARGSGRILLVEDEDMVREFVREALVEFGYEVEACSAPMEALTAATAGKFDLLVSDVIMPHMNGRDLYRKIRELHPVLKVLYISGYPARGGSLKDLFDGSDPLLQKPFTATALLKKLHEVMAEGRPSA